MAPPPIAPANAMTDAIVIDRRLPIDMSRFLLEGIRSAWNCLLDRAGGHTGSDVPLERDVGDEHRQHGDREAGEQSAPVAAVALADRQGGQALRQDVPVRVG